MQQKENPETKPGFKQELGRIMTQENKKRLAIMCAGAVVMYFVYPLVLMLFSQEVQANAEFLRLLILNQIFIGVIGWQANYFGKYGVYLPICFIVVFALSELVWYGVVTWQMEVDYIQTGYILYFLRKFVLRKMAVDEKKKNKPFPKSVTGKK